MIKTYQDIRPEIGNFDILLFSGNGIISNIIKAGSKSKWSHVGLALVLPEFPRELLPAAVLEDLDERQDRVLILESTTLTDIDDLLTGRPIMGVGIYPLSKRLAEYDGATAWRPITGERTPAMFKASMQFLEDFHGTPYERNKLELIRAALDTFTLKENQPDTSSLFCSEMATLHARHIGLFWPRNHAGRGPENWPANEFTPADFADPGLPFADGFQPENVVEFSR